MPWQNVEIKRSYSTKPPKKVFIEVTDTGSVRIKNTSWFRKNLGDYCTLRVDKLGGLIGLFGAKAKGDNTVSLKGTYITITDAVAVLEWDLHDNEWYEVPVNVTDARKTVTLRMRKANMLKECPIRKKTNKE